MIFDELRGVTRLDSGVPVPPFSNPSLCPSRNWRGIAPLAANVDRSACNHESAHRRRSEPGLAAGFTFQYGDRDGNRSPHQSRPPQRRQLGYPLRRVAFVGATRAPQAWPCQASTGESRCSLPSRQGYRSASRAGDRSRSCCRDRSRYSHPRCRTWPGTVASGPAFLCCPAITLLLVRGPYVSNYNTPGI